MNNSRIEKLAQMKKMATTPITPPIKTLGSKKTATSSVRDIINRRLHKMAGEENPYVKAYPKFSSRNKAQLLEALVESLEIRSQFKIGEISIFNALGYFLAFNDVPLDRILNYISERNYGKTYKPIFGRTELRDYLDANSNVRYYDFINGYDKGSADRTAEPSSEPSPEPSPEVETTKPPIPVQKSSTNPAESTGSGSGSNGDSTDVIKPGLRGQTVSDKDYTYKIDSVGLSFSWTDKYNHTGDHKQGDSKWGEMVRNLNKLNAPAPAATALPSTPAAPAAAPAPAAGSTESKNTYTSEEALLAQVLQNMYDNKLVGTPGLDLRNEVRVTKIIMDGVGGGVGKGKRYASAAARVLLNQNAGLAEPIKGANYNSLIKNTEFLGSLQQAINGLYKTAFTWSKSLSRTSPAHAGFWKRIKSKSFDEQTASSIVGAYIKEGLNFSYEGSGSTTEKETSKAYSSKNKFIKAAKLRRLKVRSQMESAIDSSAQMGRSRI
jgi:hypothetical protein